MHNFYCYTIFVNTIKVNTRMLYVSKLLKHSLISTFPNNINLHQLSQTYAHIKLKCILNVLSGLVDLFIYIKFKMTRSSKFK